MKDYLESIKKQFSYYKSLGEKTISQVADDQLLWKYNQDSNSIATVVKHMWGNMMSRWTDFLTADGEKEWREREAEFDNDLESREVILEKWEEGWKCLFDAVSPLTEADLNKTIYIRNEGHSVVEALNRQVCHYAYHVGQIVFLGKMIQGSDWNSLSIPRGGTAEFNAKKFAQDKRKQHFTDEMLDSEEDSGV